MRNGQAANTLDLEVRFADMFHSVANFPPPEHFKGFAKVYSSRNGENDIFQSQSHSFLNHTIRQYTSDLFL